MSRRAVSGHTKETTSQDDIFLYMNEKFPKLVTTHQLAFDLAAPTRRIASHQTFYRRLHARQLYGNGPVTHVPLTALPIRSR